MTERKAMLISDFLGTGKENAKSAQKCADYFEATPREITQRIEAERRNGKPICASCGRPAGYFLAADAAELETFCNQLKGRAIEIFKTRQALLKLLPGMEGAQHDTTKGNQ